MQVMHIISGLKNGGAEAILYRLVTNDKEHEHRVVAMMDDGYYGSRLREQGVDLVTLEMPPGKLTVSGLMQLWRLLRSTRPDVVQTWMYHADLAGGIVARLAGVKAVVWGLHHTTLDPQRTPRTIRLLARTCAIASRFLPARIISCSDEGVSVHGALGYRRDKLVTVNNGYDIDEFAPSRKDGERVRAQAGIAPETRLLGMVGRWHEQKDHENLLRALALLDAAAPWHCLLVGPGIDNDNATLVASLEDKKLSERVQLVGPTDNVPALMNALDIHVLSSAFGEAFPNVIAEAMACGTPCVTTDVGDAALMVGDTGWTAPPSNPEALARALQLAIEATADHAAWAQRADAVVARVAERFALPGMIKGYATVWESALTSSRLG